VWYLRCRVTGEGLPPAWDHVDDARAALAGSELLELVEAPLLDGWWEARQWEPRTIVGRRHRGQHPAMLRSIHGELARLRDLFHAGRLP
jgi:hypothetical protein